MLWVTLLLARVSRSLRSQSSPVIPLVSSIVSLLGLMAMAKFSYARSSTLALARDESRLFMLECPESEGSSSLLNILEKQDSKLFLLSTLCLVTPEY